MIVIVDNRDSFVWNLAEYVSLFDGVKVVSNTVSINEIKKMSPDGIVISPGPSSPQNKKEVGNSPEIVLEIDAPILGVCLGHQIIAHVFGREVGKVMTDLTGIDDLGKKFGAIGFLTKKHVVRRDLTEIAVTMALIPWVNKKLYGIEP